MHRQGSEGWALIVRLHSPEKLFGGRMSWYWFLALAPWALWLLDRLFVIREPQDTYEEIPLPPVRHEVGEIQDKLDKIARAQR